MLSNLQVPFGPGTLESESILISIDGKGHANNILLSGFAVQ